MTHPCHWYSPTCERPCDENAGDCLEVTIHLWHPLNWRWWVACIRERLHPLPLIELSKEHTL